MNSASAGVRVDAPAAAADHIGDANEMVPATAVCEHMKAALTSGVALPAEAGPDLWAVFDSQGYYTAFAWEDEARKFCDRYNARADDPLKPYTMRRYVPGGVEGPEHG